VTYWSPIKRSLIFIAVHRLPHRIEADGLLLRRWTVADAAAQHEAIVANLAHLEPWMAWVALEPQPLEDRVAMLARWEREWRAGGDVLLAVLADGRIAGSCGLHRRRGPRTLEIGYWIHVDFLRRGFATRAAAALTATALSTPGIECVEIHHDQANQASGAIPRRLGYRFVGELPDRPEAPAEVGVDCVWRLQREKVPKRDETALDA
jgi:ribosomal-protein-serine acetyltransferase